MKAHKWKDEIKAWADGAEIQWFSGYYKKWMDAGTPMWNDDEEYRIKPEIPDEPIEEALIALKEGSWYPALIDHDEYVMRFNGICFVDGKWNIPVSMVDWIGEALEIDWEGRV